MKIKDNGSLNMSIDEKSILKASTEHDELVGRVKAVLGYLEIISSKKIFMSGPDLAVQIEAMLGTEPEVDQQEEDLEEELEDECAG